MALSAPFSVYVKVRVPGVFISKFDTLNNERPSGVNILKLQVSAQLMIELTEAPVLITIFIVDPFGRFGTSYGLFIE